MQCSEEILVLAFIRNAKFSIWRDHLHFQDVIGTETELRAEGAVGTFSDIAYHTDGRMPWHVDHEMQLACRKHNPSSQRSCRCSVRSIDVEIAFCLESGVVLQPFQVSSSSR